LIPPWEELGAAGLSLIVLGIGWNQVTEYIH
jgi:hypothetical protein